MAVIELIELISLLVEGVQYFGKRWWKGKPLDRSRRWIDPRRGNVDIQVYSYTGETMYPLIAAVLQEKLATGLSGGRVSIRILTRNPNHPYLLRNEQSAPAYEQYNADVSRRIVKSVQDWRDLAHWFQNLDVQIRSYAFEPSIKCVLINGIQGYFGFYHIDPRHSKLIDGEVVVAPDWVAESSHLTELVHTRRGLQGLVVSWFKEWFEIVWRDFSTRVASSMN